MAQRHGGETWVVFFRTTRNSYGKRVENKIAIALVQSLPEKDQAWGEVERLHLHINEFNSRTGHYIRQSRANLR